MARSSFMALARAAVVAGIACACSLLSTEVTRCEHHDQCRAGFGLGVTCGADGLCERAAPFPRCATTYPEDLFERPQVDRVVLGTLMDRGLATQRARERAVRLALKQINEQGGLDSERTFGVVMCTIEENTALDDRSRAQAAVAAARYLVDVIDVPAIIGPSASGDTREVFLAVKDRGVLVISPSATSPALSALKDPPFTDESPGLLWRTAPPDSLQGRAIAEDMSAPGEGRGQSVSSVAVAYEQGPYGNELTAMFAAVFPGTVVPFPYDNEAMRAEAIAAAGAEAVDEVLFISSQAQDIIAFLDATVLPAYDARSLFLTDAAANRDVLEQASPLRLDRVRGSRPATPDALHDLVYSTFLAAYIAEYQEDPSQFSFTANAYDAAWLVAYGVAWAELREGEIRGVNIARGLRRLSAGPATDIRPSTWRHVLGRFREGQPVDIKGSSGNLDYDPETEETVSDIEIWRIEDGVMVRVATWSP